ncbi:YbaN family protein [Ferrimonas futtsuensis]|uniref:YbaN family protein n=1 Tax=Ferrimonas futtsuensis TaxID=364764 RepID=UPI00146CD00F|nr:YbaN family protein [Ferrimonas futtsuensis]
MHQINWPWLIPGSVCLALALLGIALPLLPTVPFLLLASVCFSRAHPACQRWLMTHPWFGPPLDAYLNRRPMTSRQLALTLASLWLGMALAITLAPLVLFKLALAGIGLGVSLHLWRRLSPPGDAALG